jgi:hypothetical protein
MATDAGIGTRDAARCDSVPARGLRHDVAEWASIGLARGATDRAEGDRYLAAARAAVSEAAVFAATAESASWTLDLAIAATVPLRPMLPAHPDHGMTSSLGDLEPAHG